MMEKIVKSAKLTTMKEKMANEVKKDDCVIVETFI